MTGWLGASSRWLALACSLALAACVSRPPVPPPAAPPVAWHRTAVGLCEDYPEETRTLAHARADLAAAHAAGAQVLRIAFGWDSMEPVRGRYDWSFWDEFVRMATDDYGLRLIPYVCYTPKWAASDPGSNYWRSPPKDPADFGRFMGEIVRHFRGRIQSWELWNEPDNRDFWLGTPAQFAALVRAGSAAVRAADPHARVVLGGLAGELGFLRTLLEDDHLGPAVDVINLHSYFETWHPNPIERLPAYIAQARQIVREAGGRQELWMAETGYSSIGDRADVSSSYREHFIGEHTEYAQAGAVARTLLTTLATQELSLVAWYRINDLPNGQDVIGDDNNRHLGLLRTDGTRKPAYAAFAYFAHRFSQPYDVVPPLVTTLARRDGAVPEVRAFRLRDGRWLVGAWLAMPATRAMGNPEPDRRQAVVRVVLPGIRARRAAFRDFDARTAFGVDAGARPTREGTELTWTLRAGEVRMAELTP